jgi:hypothetical protein
MIDREFKWIDKVVWEISKRFLNTLEAENNNPNFEFFYTLPKSPLQHISAKFESCMNENHGRRRSQILLDAHKAIVTQVVTTRCACKCPFENCKEVIWKNIMHPNAFYYCWWLWRIKGKY